ncbi:MAG: Zn-dependent hydrolase, partial [Afipia sp.]|nr:Zn-dependent hydrolase [Afipia sp.]
HLRMATFGERPDGGVNRQALSYNDGLARVQLKEWAESLGYACSIDAIGNMFVRREGQDPSLPPIITGSHLDSQPAGGKFDGVSGVLAGLEALQALDAADVVTRRAIEVVSWTNEEGSRFAPGVMGSSVFTGQLSMRETLLLKDKDEIQLSDELTKILDMMKATTRREAGFPVAAYIELHIEQGPILESSHSTIGVVTGIQGTQWFEIEVSGAEAHAGTTPSRMRRDAMKIAVAIISELEHRYIDETDSLRFTVGRMSVEPNSPNTVPSKVTFTVDLRHPEASVLAKACDDLRFTCRRFAGSCSVAVRETLKMSPVTFASNLISLLDRAANSLSLRSKHLISGAFHDAKLLAAVCPSAMIFIPCAGGVSHSPAESATASDIAAGTRVLALALAELGNMPPEYFEA